MSEIVLWVPSFGEQVTLSGFSLLKSCWNFAPRHLENCSKMTAYCLHRLLTMLPYVDLRSGGKKVFFTLLKAPKHTWEMSRQQLENQPPSLQGSMLIFLVVHSYLWLSRSSKCAKAQEQLMRNPQELPMSHAPAAALHQLLPGKATKQAENAGERGRGV